MGIIPKHIRALGVSIRRANSNDDPDDILEFSPGQSKARLDKQFEGDRQKGIAKRNCEAARLKGILNRTHHNNRRLRGDLKKRIKKLESENEQEQRFLT